MQKPCKRNIISLWEKVYQLGKLDYKVNNTEWKGPYISKSDEQEQIIFVV